MIKFLKKKNSIIVVYFIYYALYSIPTYQFMKNLFHRKYQFAFSYFFSVIGLVSISIFSKKLSIFIYYKLSFKESCKENRA